MSKMLNEFRRIFRRSVEAFRSELNAMEPEDQVAELLMAMRRELVAARAALPEYEAELSRSRSELARERDALAQCERRGALAARIDDHETVRIAEEFATRHRTRIGVLEQKVAASGAELVLRRDEADEMRRRYQEADVNRFALLAQLRRSAAKEGMRAAGDPGAGPSADFSRMEERVERGAHYADALEELDEPDAAASGPTREAAVEERLRELKRRMGRADSGAD